MDQREVIWSDVKNKINKRKHGISFPFASSVFYDHYILSTYDKSHSDDEDRWTSIGTAMDGTLIVVNHTFVHDEIIRIISARKATRREKKVYISRRERKL